MGRETLKDAKRLNQITKFLFDNRRTLTQDDFVNTLRTLSQEVFTYAYDQGWGARNEIYRICANQRRLRMDNDYSEFYDKHTTAVGNVDGTKPILVNQLELFEDLWRDWK